MQKILRIVVAIIICFNCLPIYSITASVGEFEDSAAFSSKPANMIQTPRSANGFQTCGAAAAHSGYTYAEYFTGPNRYTFTRHTENPTNARNPFGLVLKNNNDAYKLSGDLKPNTNYVFSAEMRLANNSMGGGEPTSTVSEVPFSIGISSDGQPVPNDMIATQIISGSEVQMFKQVVSSPDFGAVNPNYFVASIGLPNSFTDNGGSVAMIAESENPPYFAEEAAYDMTIEETADKVEAEIGEALEFKAELKNQLDIPGKLTQEFDWLVVKVNEEGIRTEAATDSFEIISNGATAAVTAKEGTVNGDYAVIARSKEYDDENGNKFQKGITIKVLKPKINEDATRNVDGKTYSFALTKDNGTADMGLFNTLTLSAKIDNGTGDITGCAQNFKWYVIDEDRRDIISEGVKVLPSENTATAVISLENTVSNGTYVIVAESVAAESFAMRKLFSITVDTSGAVTEVISNLKTDDIATLKSRINDYSEILHLDFEPAAKVNVEDWCKVIHNSAQKNTPASEEDARAFLKNAAVVSLYNVNEANVSLYDTDAKFIYERELGLKNINTAGITIYSLLDEVMNINGRESVQAALKGKGFEDNEAFSEAATKIILLNAIAYPDTLGNGYLDKVLTKENLEAVGISAEKFIELDDRSACYEKLSGKTVTLDTLREEIENAEEPEEESSDSSSSSSSGGRGNSKNTFGGKYSVTSPEVENAEDKVAAEVLSYKDVLPSHWAYTDIYHLTERGIFSGRDKLHFAPEESISREEFVKLVCVAFKLENKASEKKFSDVADGAWYKTYVETAYESDIIKGISDDSFGVGMPISRQDICVILVRALGAELSEENSSVMFGDFSMVSDYAVSAVSYLSSLGAVNGFEDGKFYPAQTCTRAQTAKILCAVLKIGGITLDE